MPKKILPRGFTLIELLVVITIMSIISIVAVTLYRNIQGDSRDSKRRAEMEAIATALEVNKTQGSYYNPLVASMFGSLVFPGGITSEAQDPQGYPYCISSGIPVLPSDLSGVSGWSNTVGSTSCPTTPVGWNKLTGTQPSNTTISWTLCTRLENKGTPQAFCRTNSQ